MYALKQIISYILKKKKSKLSGEDDVQLMQEQEQLLE
jgi:hypothetical protein